MRRLRRRGFVVVREGERCRVGNALCSLAALRAKAARERRLLEANRPVEIMAAQAKAGHMDNGGRPSTKTGLQTNPVSKAPTLAEAGIDKNLAHRARTLGSVLI